MSDQTLSLDRHSAAIDLYSNERLILDHPKAISEQLYFTVVQKTTTQITDTESVSMDPHDGCDE